MSWGVAGGPSLWTWSSPRREGDLPWERSGDNSLCPDSVVWEPLQVQATKSSNVAYTIRISSLELYKWAMCYEWYLYCKLYHFLLFQLAYHFVYVCLSLCVLLCNDHLWLVWAELNPDDDTPLLNRSWALAWVLC